MELEQPAFWVLLIAASTAHAFPVIAPRHQAYHATLAFLMAAVLLLSWPAVAAIVLTTHITEWLRRRRPWYIQLYNVAVYLLGAGAAIVVMSVSGVQDFALGDARALAAAVCAATAFLLVNHALTATVLRLARGVSIADSGLFGRQSLSIDAALLVLGIVIAGAWVEQPLAAIVAAAPLVLIYRALRMANVEVTDQPPDPSTASTTAVHFEEASDTNCDARCTRRSQLRCSSVLLDDVPRLVCRRTVGRRWITFSSPSPSCRRETWRVRCCVPAPG